jgi:hypothetical protein
MHEINWDVAIDSKNMCMGIGIIARDCEGQVITAKCQTICVRQKPVVAEAQMALCAGEFCCDLDYRILF